MTPERIQQALTHPEVQGHEHVRAGRVPSHFEVDSLELDMLNSFAERWHPRIDPDHWAWQVRGCQEYIGALRFIADSAAPSPGPIDAIKKFEEQRKKEREAFEAGIKEGRAQMGKTSMERRMLNKSKSWRASPECKVIRGVGIGLAAGVGAATGGVGGSVLVGALADAASDNLCQPSKPIITWSDFVCKRTGWPCESDQS